MIVLWDVGTSENKWGERANGNFKTTTTQNLARKIRVKRQRRKEGDGLSRDERQPSVVCGVVQGWRDTRARVCVCVF